MPDADHDSFDFADVEVGAASYSTYRAVVLFLITTQIKFAPLRSSFDPDSPAEMVDASVSDANSSTRPLVRLCSTCARTATKQLMLADALLVPPRKSPSPAPRLAEIRLPPRNPA